MVAKVAVAVLGILILGSSTVYAAKHIWGIKDFAKNLPAEAESYIDTNVTVENDAGEALNLLEDFNVNDNLSTNMEGLVTFAVKETVSDSTNCHICIEATLHDAEQYLLVPTEYTVSKQEEGYDYTHARVYYDDAKPDESIEEYAIRNGKKILLVESYLTMDGTHPIAYSESISGVIVDDTHALLHIGLGCDDKSAEAFADGTKLPVTNSVSLFVNDGYHVWEECKSENITITLNQVAGNEKTVQYALEDGKEMRVEDGPVILKSITLTNTPLETKVSFVVINEDKEWGNWMSINLIDDEGNIFDRGTSGGGGASAPDSKGMFTDNRSYKKMDFPDHVNVKVRNLDTDEIYILENIPIVK